MILLIKVNLILKDTQSLDNTDIFIEDGVMLPFEWFKSGYVKDYFNNTGKRGM